MLADQAKDFITKTFNYPFDEVKFGKLINEIFKDIQNDGTKQINLDSYKSFEISKFVKNINIVGSYKDNENEEIYVCYAKLKGAKIVEKNKSVQRRIAKLIMDLKETENILIAFFAENYEDWRLSLIQKIQYTEIKNKKIIVKTDLSDLKRFSYLVGKNEPNHTAKLQLSPLIINENKIKLDELKKAFSVEKVTKEFFQKYRELCFIIKDELKLIRKNNKNIDLTFNENKIENIDFAKKLLGQIVFLYFIQKKGWLGIKRNNDGIYDKWGGGPKNFLRKLFEKEYSDYNNFFNDILEPLFYVGLSSENLENYYPKLDCKIPFLNGGLFEPIKNYNWSETDITISDQTFEKIFNTFDQYNFTVQEDDPLDKEIAIDPEMLGKIFESLLSENIRKGKGAFYTPTEIVKYMCQESLIHFLYNNFKNEFNYEVINNLVKNSDNIFYNDYSIYKSIENDKDISNEYITPKKIRQKAREIDLVIKKIKICDPAIGSGAFPVTMMIEIVKIRKILLIHQNKDPNIYRIKRNIIQNCIYGVDIDAGALEITKLRLWLSLVVEENSLNNISPLPNLDFKIIQGNSLFEDYDGIKIFDENLLLNFSGEKDQYGFNFFESSDLSNELHSLSSNYFSETNRIKKNEIKNKILKLQWKLIQVSLKEQGKKEELKNIEIIEKEGNNKFFLWKLNFSDVFNNGGFDIVIGNPPYGYKFNKKDKKLLKQNYEVVPDYESSCYFERKSLEIIKDNGIKCFIIPNTFLINLNAKKYRKKILNDWKILKLINISKSQIFDEAGVRNCITLYEKNSYRNSHLINFIEMVDNNKIINDKYFLEEQLIYKVDNWLTAFSQKDESIKLIEKIKHNSLPLANYAEVSQGLIPYDKYRGHSEATIKNKIWHSNFKKDNTYRKELKGKDINKYSLNWNGQLWISYGDWLAAPRKKEFFTKPRILVREVTNPEILATFVEDEYYNRPSILNITNFREISPYTLLGIINSSLMNFYHFENSPKTKKGMFPKVLVDDIRKFPITKKINNDLNYKIEKNVIEILKLKKTNTEKVKNNEKNFESKINSYVFKLYDINKEQQDYIQEHLINLK